MNRTPSASPPSRPVAAMVSAVASLLLILFAAAPALARQEPVSVHASTPKSAYTGDAFELQVIVRGSRGVQRPTVPVTPAYSVEYLGPTDASSFTATLINGQFVQSSNIIFVHKFSIRARHAGEITIPSFDVVVDGQTYQTRPQTIQVQEPSQSGDFTFTITPDKTRIYEGEPVRVRFVWKYGKQPHGASFQFPALPDGCEFLAAPDPRPAGGAGMPQDDGRFPQISLGDNESVIATTSVVTEGGRRIGVLSFDRILVARAPCRELRYGAARIDFNAVIGQRAPRFTDGPFADLNEYSRQVCVSKPFEIEVIPLPERGRPADFSGLVGQYSVTASADPREASVGEPMTLRVTVSGPPPLSLIPVFDLTQQPLMSSRFRVPRDPVLPMFTPIGAMFTYPIRARSPEATEIPPIELNYFDTDAGEYRIARSAPISIKIHPSATAGSDAELPDDDDSARAPTANASSRVDAAPLALSGPRPPLALLTPGTIAALVAPPGLFAAVWLGQTLRRRALAHPAQRRRRRAVRAARRRLRHAAAATAPAGSAAAVSAALTELAADWFDRPAGSLTSSEALTLLRDDASDDTGRLAGLLAECDRLRFSAPTAPTTNPDSAGLLERTREVLERTAASLRSRTWA